MASIIATIDEALVNAAAAAVGELKGTLHKEERKKVPVPGICYRKVGSINVPYPCIVEKEILIWSITVNWSVKNLRFDIEEGSVRIKADCHFDATGVSYTATVDAVVAVALQETTLVLTPQSFKLPLYGKPLGVRIDLGSIDILEILPPSILALKIPLGMLKEPIAIPLPGGHSLTVTPSNVRLALKKDCIIVSADLNP